MDGRTRDDTAQGRPASADQCMWCGAPATDEPCPAYGWPGPLQPHMVALKEWPEDE